ncbi:MAG: DUF362 domain-containing protein [Deltaproteobacteria bacterium]|nr:DUF362 domain-containing protein [Deltaproteobacteria bacterium]
MDPEKAYAGIGLLLQKLINDQDENAWGEIAARIDYIYENINKSMTMLETETGFGGKIEERLKKGQKLLFKPNLVTMMGIDPVLHGPGPMTTALTDWSFVAALMRWFHDSLSISYHQMSLGEAATAMPSASKMLTQANPFGESVTSEAAIEGKCGDFYGGWGFYFVRKYLAEGLAESAKDDPMAGYYESISGTYIPPGRVTDKLMVYDLNRIFDDPSKGLLCNVPDGVNFKSIMLHKAVVGGDKSNAGDMADYPGAILINVPKFKVHCITLFTNVIKNLGIGLYPMQYASQGGTDWDYSVPHSVVPGMKGPIPHLVWVPKELDKSGMPSRDNEGNYIVEKTGGITATMIDIIRAVEEQDIMMVHVVDGIEAVNQDHMGSANALLTPEGVVFASLDPVAVDNLSARYMFSNVGLKDALESGIRDRAGGYFPQAVPVPKVQDGIISTSEGYDCPLARDYLFESAEARGLGSRDYYALGIDGLTGASIVSIDGRLGLADGSVFKDIVTKTLFFDIFKFPWDLQATAYSYLKATDSLTGSNHFEKFIKAFDEDADGVISYEEMGKKGVWSSMLYKGGLSASRMGDDPMLTLKRSFSQADMLKNADEAYNEKGHHLMREFLIGNYVLAAFRLSQLEAQVPDPLKPGLTFGQGNWPTYETAKAFFTGMNVFGPGYPFKVTAPGLYSTALIYADITQNEGKYAAALGLGPVPVNPEVPHQYVEDVINGTAEKLSFTLYVPAGFETLAGLSLPNIEITEKETRFFTAVFPDGTVLPVSE